MSLHILNHTTIDPLSTSSCVETEHFLLNTNKNRNNMSSVFGVVVVSKVEKTAEKSFKLLCVDEGQSLDSKPTRTITSNVEYPIGSRFYWEYWYRTGESVVTPMPSKDCSLVI